MKISALFVGLLLMIQERVVFAEETTFIEPVAVDKYAYEVAVNPQVQTETEKYLEKFTTLDQVAQVDNLKVLVKNYVVPELTYTIKYYNSIMKILKEDFKEISIEEERKYELKIGVQEAWDNIKHLVEPVLGELNLHNVLMPILKKKMVNEKKITKEEAKVFIEAIRSLSSTINNTMKRMTDDNQFVIKLAIQESETKYTELENKLKTLEESKTADDSKHKEEIIDLKAQILVAQNIHSNLQESYSTLQDKYNNQIKEINTEIETLKSKAGTDEKRIKDLESQEQAITNQHDKDLATLADKVKRITELENEVSQLKGLILDEKAKVLTGSQTSTNDKTKIETLEKTVKELETKIANLLLDKDKVIVDKDKVIASKQTELEECQDIEKKCNIIIDALDATGLILPGVFVVATLLLLGMWACFRGKQQAQGIIYDHDTRKGKGKTDSNTDYWTTDTFQNMEKNLFYDRFNISDEELKKHFNVLFGYDEIVPKTRTRILKKLKEYYKS